MKLAIHGGVPIRTRPFSSWPELHDGDKSAVLATLESRAWSAVDLVGSQCARFEREFATFHGIEDAVTVSSGTAALMIALKVVGVGHGDEVIVPALSYAATATAASQLGAVPVFVDIDAETHNIQASLVEAALSPRTRAVVVVHLHGYPLALPSLVDLANRYGLPLIEDCAQAHGATYGGERVGTFGVISAFSFASTKNLSSGEGGAVLTNDRLLANEARALRDHGRPPGCRHDHPTLGWNFRMTEIQAALLRAQLPRLDERLVRKRAAARFLSEQVARLKLPWLRGASLPSDGEHGLFCFPLYYDGATTNVSPTVFARALASEGIPAGNRATLALPDIEVYRTGDVPSRNTGSEVAREVARTLIRMGQPVGSGMLLDPISDLHDVVRAFEKIAANLGHLTMDAQT